MEILASLLLWLGLQSPPAPRPPVCTFPGSACLSPSGSWSLRSEDTADAAAHILVATRLRNGRQRPIYTFSGRIEALWSPDGRYVAITDYSFGEGDADLYVADLDASALVNAEQELHRTMKSAPPTRLNGRRLFHALEWQSPTSLRFEARTFDSASDHDGRVVLTFDIPHRQVR